MEWKDANGFCGYSTNNMGNDEWKLRENVFELHCTSKPSSKLGKTNV